MHPGKDCAAPDMCTESHVGERLPKEGLMNGKRKDMPNCEFDCGVSLEHTHPDGDARHPVPIEKLGEDPERAIAREWHQKGYANGYEEGYNQALIDCPGGH